MRHPARALAALAVLLLTGCGSLAERADTRSGIASAIAFATHGAGTSVGTSLALPADTCGSLFGCAPASAFARGPRFGAGTSDIDPAVLNASAGNAGVDATIRQRTGDLPQPSWWNGVCNANVYRGAKPLGASYRGVQACGPQPGGSQGRLVRFYPGAWGLYEWQCTELVFRYLHLAFGVAPYNAPTGGQLVDNWRPEHGGRFEKVRNGSGAMPAPGDVISTTGTHAAIVTAVDVDLTGHGTITLLEQNAPNNGSSTLKVNNWRIDRVKNWLHVLD
jgi:hypothetical protein